ncbi:hypothetical protein JD844_015287 [Phrynosoma platyrhinos]|uniref:GST N-terminal domain-containing protein n=1 Tax=Phrynosoma platyrhinos TaxID=52577 RepID=A0ABQ7T7H9_PHRPL|nr:hypothetical protein JD844_015287 [Phrynosoma platyrhinos]
MLIVLRLVEQREEAFLKVNPVGQVPAMKDGDFALSERSVLWPFSWGDVKALQLPSSITRRSGVLGAAVQQR